MRFKNSNDYCRTLDIFWRFHPSIILSGKGDFTSLKQLSKPAITAPPALCPSSSITPSELSIDFGPSKMPGFIPGPQPALGLAFKRPQTSSSETVRPDSAFSVGVATETGPFSPVSCQPSVKPTLRNFRPPNSSIFISQLEREVRLRDSILSFCVQYLDGTHG
jgi:hypothetical protein